MDESVYRHFSRPRVQVELPDWDYYRFNLVDRPPGLSASVTEEVRSLHPPPDIYDSLVEVMRAFAGAYDDT